MDRVLVSNDKKIKLNPVQCRIRPEYGTLTQVEVYHEGDSFDTLRMRRK